MKPVVYLAGPYSKPDPMVNMHKAIALADRLLDVCVPVVPHLTGTWHMVSPKPYQVWLELDRAILARCDVVLRFEGESAGADSEARLARELGIPVVWSEDELRDLIADRAIVPFLDRAELVVMTHYYVWANNAKRATLYGLWCRIIATGRMGSCLVEFENGQREIVSRRALRRRPILPFLDRGTERSA